MRRALVVFFFAVSSITFACKDDPNRPPAASDTGQAPTTGAGGGGGANADGGNEGGLADAGTDSGDAGVCNTLANDADVVDQNRIVGDPPTGTGGNVADGTYELTSADLYVGASGTPGPSGATFQGVIRITAGTFERTMNVVANQGAAPIESRSIATYTAAGTTFTATQSCPAPFQDQYTYSVVGNTLNLTSLLTKESFTFTLR